ncbi:MAG: hypothetical protein PHO41_09910 [Eubacteriales bacterium]|nr:hypothetical protein [Eubacteriales bacterium]
MGIITTIPIEVGTVYWAKATVGESGALSYATPEEICGTSKVVTAYTKTLQKQFESGSCIYKKPHISDINLKITTQTMQLDVKERLMHGIALSDGDTVYNEGADTDNPERGAIGWYKQLSNGKYECNWLLDATASPVDETNETGDDGGAKFNPDEIEFIGTRRPVDKYLRRREVVDDAAGVTTFFAAVDPAAD